MKEFHLNLREVLSFTAEDNPSGGKAFNFRMT